MWSRFEVHHRGDRYVVEEQLPLHMDPNTTYADFNRRRAFETEAEARYYAAKHTALQTGTIQAMAFGWCVDGVGELRLDFDAPSPEPAFEIEPSNIYCRLLGKWQIFNRF